MKQKPSFQCYPQDFLGSLDFQLMSVDDVGCYWLLLLNCYNNGGTLPKNEEDLRMLCRGKMPSQKVMKKFYEDGDFLRNKRVDIELRKQAKFSKIQSKNAKKRWDKPDNDDPKSMPSHSHGIDSASIRQSSSTSSSTSKKEKYKKKKNELDPIGQQAYDSLNNLCLDLGLENMVDPQLYANTCAEYSLKFPVLPAVRECLYWCKSKDKKQITIMRIRNWLKNKKDWDKQALLKKQTEKQDSSGKDPYLKPFYKPPVDMPLGDPRLAA